MLATNGPRWFDRTTPDPRWPSIGVSLALTVAMFASALAAMRSFGPWHSPLALIPDKPVVVRLTPPAITPPRPVTRVAPSAAPIVRAPAVIPMTIPPVAAPSQAMTRALAPSIAVPVPGATAVDSGVGRGTSVGRAAAATDRTYAGGAPIARSGFVAPAKTQTAEARDSILRRKMESIVELAKRPPTGAMAAEMDQSARVADRMRRRATTAGNGRDVVIMNGQGKDGVGAVGNPNGGMFTAPGVVGYSIPFPLFYPGPSPEQRKKNEALDRDYQARLKRLQDRAHIQDSLRRVDSVRKDSVAKARRIIP